MQLLSGGGFQVEGQWEQCATPGLAPIALDQLAWGLRWDLHVHPVHGNSYSPPTGKSVAKHTDMHISYLTFSDVHIQTHTDTYIHIHDTDIYGQPEPEPTGNRDSVITVTGKFKSRLRQVGLECNVSGDTWSYCHSQRMARAFSKPESCEKCIKLEIRRHGSS